MSISNLNPVSDCRSDMADVTSTFIVFALLHHCSAEISNNPQRTWFSANVISDPSYSPRPLTDIFPTQVPFSPTNPIVVLPTTNTPLAPVKQVQSATTTDANIQSTTLPPTTNAPTSVNPPTIIAIPDANNLNPNKPNVLLIYQQAPQSLQNLNTNNQLQQQQNAQPTTTTPSPCPTTQAPVIISATNPPTTTDPNVPNPTFPPQITTLNAPSPTFLLVQNPGQNPFPQVALGQNPAFNGGSNGLNPIFNGQNPNFPNGPNVIFPPFNALNPSLNINVPNPNFPNPNVQNSNVYANNPNFPVTNTANPTQNPTAPPVNGQNPAFIAGPNNGPIPSNVTRNGTLPNIRIRLVSPSGSITNVNIGGPSTVMPRTTTRRIRRNNLDDCIDACGGRRTPICAAPLAVRPINPNDLKGFPSVCHLACNNSFRRNLYEKVIDGRCGRLRTQIRTIDTADRLRRPDLNRNQYTIVPNPETVIEFSPLGQ